VADQGVELEHIVQDSCSDDGTQDWLPHDPRVKAYIEKDKGMYDAVNRGFQRAKGEILAYINCDEQYLPGALRVVWEHFQKHPELEIIFADTVVVEADGRFNCFRKVLRPLEYHTAVCSLATLTCSTFMRRSVIEHRKLLFDTKYRDLGDSDWVLRAIRSGARMGVLRYYTSIFTETGENMNLLPNAMRERKEFLALAPGWVRKLRPLWLAHHRMRRLLSGTLRQAPFTYSIYTSSSPEKRVAFKVDKPVAQWIRPAPKT
jgi:glycosyltransferase involved in cell wall biosynthesis